MGIEISTYDYHCMSDLHICFWMEKEDDLCVLFLDEPGNSCMGLFALLQFLDACLTTFLFFSISVLRKCAQIKIHSSTYVCSKVDQIEEEAIELWGKGEKRNLPDRTFHNS